MRSEGELPAPGTLVAGRYRLQALLGRGGMGAVFDADDTQTSRVVAVKWMLPRYADDASAVSRFFLEARAAGRIEHPNVIEVIDAGVDGGAPFLVMERLRGESLASRLERGRLGVVEALELLGQACRGVAEAHREGVVHRDLKPANIFLCHPHEGSLPHVKILDFGVAKLYEHAGDAPLTTSRVALGTPPYMSPEQLGQPGRADPSFDVDAMGVVLYQSLGGRLPYEAAGMLELVRKIAEGRPVPLRALAPDVPPVLEMTVMRAMHAEAAVRHARMDELAAELEAIRRSIEGDGPPPLAPLAAALDALANAETVDASTVAEHAPTRPAPSLPSAHPTTALPSTRRAPSAVPEQLPSMRRAPSTRPARRARSDPPPAPSRPLGAALISLLALAIVALSLTAVGIGDLVWRRDRRSASPAQARSTPHASIDLAFSGCAPAFDGSISVTNPRPGQLVVASQRGDALSGSLLVEVGERGLFIALTDAQGRAFLSRDEPTSVDRSTNVYQLRRFSPSAGQLDLTFQGAVLVPVEGAGTCQVRGRVQTFGLTYGE